MARTQMCGSDTKHEADGIHQVGLACHSQGFGRMSHSAPAPRARVQEQTHTRTVGPNNCREGQERAEGLVALVGLEILDLEPQQHGEYTVCVGYTRQGDYKG